MKTRELRVKYANQQSFYGKAFVKEDSEATQYLYSYYSASILIHLDFLSICW